MLLCGIPGLTMTPWCAQCHITRKSESMNLICSSRVSYPPPCSWNVCFAIGPIAGKQQWKLMNVALRMMRRL